MYIAQPPLYKVKIGKKEQYIKDDKAFKVFLFDWAKEHTALSIGSKELAADAWQKLLVQLGAYDEQLSFTSSTFRVTYNHCHQLIALLAQSGWKGADGIGKLLEHLKGTFADYEIVVEKPELPEPQEGEEAGPEPTLSDIYISFTQLSKQWKVPVAFFTSPVIHTALDLLKPVTDIETNTWLLKVIGKERTITDTGATKLLAAIRDISKPYMNVQRYKGLGEMNPEQLWETSMDPKSRVFLQVSIEDALEADNWFNTLMGDDVSGRKQYISEYGHFVKNLDI